MQQCRRQQIVANEHCHLVVVFGIHRSLPPTLAALVHHIVVNETGGMEQFKTYGGILCDIGHIAEIACHQQDEHRTHALAGALTDICKGLRQ